MKTLRNLLIVVIGATALTAVPVKSHAGILGDLGDIFALLFGNGNKGWHYTPPPPPPPHLPVTTGGPNTPIGGGGNSVPLGAGSVFLIVAGLGLGAKLLVDQRGAASNPIQ
jgi:hypothetical protein